MYSQHEHITVWQLNIKSHALATAYSKAVISLQTALTAVPVVVASTHETKTTVRLSHLSFRGPLSVMAEQCVFAALLADERVGGRQKTEITTRALIYLFALLIMCRKMYCRL